MQVTFRIEYYASPKETIQLICPDIRPGTIPMVPGVSGQWSVGVEFPDRIGEISYRYRLCASDGTVLRDEWGTDRRRRFRNGTRSVNVYDRWRDRPDDSTLLSTAFTDCIFRRHDTAPQLPPVTPGYFRLEVEAPAVDPRHILAISGSCDALGNWDTDAAPLMNDSGYPVWIWEIPLDKLPDSFEYKFVVKDAATGKVTAWENGANHVCRPDRNSNAAVVSGLHFTPPLAPWRGAGTAIPVFSLRTEADCGTGDFYSLIPLIDWAARTGQNFVQILPINDTTMTHTKADSYPYNAISTFALHPMYIHIEALGCSDRKLLADLRREADELNRVPYVDYERVNSTKLRFTRAFFDSIGQDTLQSHGFMDFCRDNIHWLKPYAAYCIQRDLTGTTELSQWGDLSVYSEEKADRLIAEHSGDYDFVCYIQYHLHRQLLHVSDYARSKGVAIKGDIPIGISRNSVDAWLYPELFNLDKSAGAPPDDFSMLGQNWGFPTYNWQRMSLDGFTWWKARFRKMAEYFDAYRIDHLLGFFRIWQIPRNSVRGLLGTFYPALPFTPEELRERFGFRFDAHADVNPPITDDLLLKIFGEEANMVILNFLSPLPGGYRLKEKFDTQLKLQRHFATLPHSECNTALLDGLYRLTEDRLFIEDPEQNGTYHPRIAARDTYRYSLLDAGQRAAFDALYEDFFYHRHNDFWRRSAMWKLPPLIDSTRMLVCAEDLGMIPSCVPDVMERLNMLSLEVQRMPKGFEQFADTRRYPYLSVCTTSTHDMGGLRLWWLGLSQEERNAYCHNILYKEGNAPDKDTPDLCREIIARHLQSPAMLCILPLQDWLSISATLRSGNPAEEQINNPADPHHFWRYRMHRTMESIAADTDYTSEVTDMIKSFR